LFGGAEPVDRKAQHPLPLRVVRGAMLLLARRATLGPTVEARFHIVAGTRAPWQGETEDPVRLVSIGGQRAS